MNKLKQAKFLMYASMGLFVITAVFAYSWTASAFSSPNYPATVMENVIIQTYNEASAPLEELTVQETPLGALTGPNIYYEMYFWKDINLYKNLVLKEDSDIKVEMEKPILVSTVTGSIGNLGANDTFYVKLTAIDGVSGQTAASNEISTSTTIGAEGFIISWTAIQGAVADGGIRVWIGTTTDTYYGYFSATNTTSYLVTATSSLTVASIPTVTTANVNRIVTSGNSFILGGNVGIGTSSPDYPLDVDGDFRVGEAGAANAFFVDATNQRIGIGSSTPTDDLSIGTDGATSTIMMGKLCFRAAQPDGTFWWITLGMDQPAGQPLATSTIACN